MDWRWTTDMMGLSPPRTGWMLARNGRTGLSTGFSTLGGGVRMYPSSAMDWNATDKETSSSPSSSVFLNALVANSKLGSRTSSSESLLPTECRWDNRFKIQTAPFGGKPTEMKNLTPEEVDDEAQERSRQSMSSGSSNASTDSVTSSGSRSGSLNFHSSWTDLFASPLWDSDLTASSDDPLFFDGAPYAEDLETFMQSFYASLRASKWSSSDSNNSMEHVKLILERFVSSRSQLTHQLAENMNVRRLLTPFLEFDLPSEAILLLNASKNVLPSTLDEDSLSSMDLPLGNGFSLLSVYVQNPVFHDELNRLRWTFDRLDTNKEVMAFFVWSRPDSCLLCLPCTKVNPYPLCRSCSRRFGTRSCAQCQIVRYCSRECQVQDWDDHQHSCIDMRDSVSDRIDLFTLFDLSTSTLSTSSTSSPPKNSTGIPK